MAYQQDGTKHKSNVIVYSIYELEKWMRQTRRVEQDNARFKLSEREGGHEMLRFTSDCPVCGWPPGQKGYVRAPAMPGEWAFGKLFACPECWPYPLGKKDAMSISCTDEEQRQVDAAKPRVGRT